MNIISFMNKLSAIGRYLVIAVVVMNIVSVSFANTAIKSAMQTLCESSQLFLGGTVMLLVVLAGTTYAIGQVMGAETRARAAVWATAMLTGAVIGAVIYLVTPPVMKALFSGSGVTLGSSSNPCSISGGAEGS